MYMTSDQYSWAMMKHGHKMLISSVCVSVFVCTMCGWLCCSVFIVWVRFSFSFRLHWLISIFLSIFCWLLHFKRLLNLNLSFFLSLCITHISLNALNIFRWTIAFQSVMFGCFFLFHLKFCFVFIFTTPGLCPQAIKRPPYFFPSFHFHLYRKSNKKKRNIKWTSFVQKFENKIKLHSKIHLSHIHSLVQFRTKIVCFWWTKSK